MAEAWGGGAAPFDQCSVSCHVLASEHLLCEFFEFYATFPFSRMSINIRKVRIKWHEVAISANLLYMFMN